MCISVLLTCMVLCVWYPQSSGDSVRSLGTGGADGCEPPRGCWESNPGPLQEQMLFTAEPPLQTPRCTSLESSDLKRNTVYCSRILKARYARGCKHHSICTDRVYVCVCVCVCVCSRASSTAGWTSDSASVQCLAQK